MGEDGYEACDDGNAVQTDDCLNTCVEVAVATAFSMSAASRVMMEMKSKQTRAYDVLPRAVVMELFRREACDDGNDVDSDGCTNDCRLPTCGDGVVQGRQKTAMMGMMTIRMSARVRVRPPYVEMDLFKQA